MKDEAGLTTDLTASRPNLFRAWLPAILWIGLIAFESTDVFSAEHTSRVLFRVVSRLFGHIDLYQFFLFHQLLRKAGHFIGYGVLSLLLLRGWRATLGQTRALLMRASLLSWLGTISIAALDEWHQSYIPSRVGTWRDVTLDTVAGVAFLVIGYFRLRRSD